MYILSAYLFQVYKRLEQAIEIENLIAKFLPKCPNYVPPIAVFDLDSSTNAPTVTLISTKKAKRGRKAGSGKGLVIISFLYYLFEVDCKQ